MQKTINQEILERGALIKNKPESLEQSQIDYPCIDPCDLIMADFSASIQEVFSHSNNKILPGTLHAVSPGNVSIHTYNKL